MQSWPQITKKSRTLNITSLIKKKSDLVRKPCTEETGLFLGYELKVTKDPLKRITTMIIMKQAYVGYGLSQQATERTKS